MTMFGTLVQRLTSPVTSPTSPRRRFKSPSRWEVQSDPEDDPAAPVRKSRAKYLLDKRKSKSRSRGLNSSEHALQINNNGGGGGGGGWQDVAFPPLRGTKSLGRLDGMKEVSLCSFSARCALVPSPPRSFYVRPFCTTHAIYDSELIPECRESRGAVRRSSTNDVEIVSLGCHPPGERGGFFLNAPRCQNGDRFIEFSMSHDSEQSEIKKTEPYLSDGIIIAFCLSIRYTDTICSKYILG